VVGDAGVEGLVVEVAEQQHGRLPLRLYGGEVVGCPQLFVGLGVDADVVADQVGDVLGDRHAERLGVLAPEPPRRPVACDHDELLTGFDQPEHDLEDVSGRVAEVDDVRVLLDDRQLPVVIGKRDVDPAQIARSGRVLDHPQVRVRRLSEQLGEDVVTLDLGDT
jgi:hypothetical protein